MTRAARAALVLVLFSLLALLDFGTSPDISFLGFYFLPVLLAAWYLGRREAIAVALASVAVWVADDIVSHRYDVSPAISIWNRSVELVFFVLLAWLAGTLKEALLREGTARSERLERDLEIAREVQVALLPPSRLKGAAFTASAVCRQAPGIGGDAYDIVPLEDEGVSVAVADVCGKGVPAALLMASFLGAFRGLLPLHADRLDLLAEGLSERLRGALAPRRFVTAFLAVLEGERLRYVNAGHEPGILIVPGRPEPTVSLLEPTGPVLGLLRSLPLCEESVPFPPGSLLLLFTDGLTERTDAAGEEFGRERVIRAAAAAAAASFDDDPGAVVRKLLQEAQDHAGERPPVDDVTILCVRSRAPLSPSASAASVAPRETVPRALAPGAWTSTRRRWGAFPALPCG